MTNTDVPKNPIKDFIDGINISSSYNNKLSIFFILFQLIMLGSILSTTDIDILLAAKPFSKISFSGFDVQVPFRVIYILFPLILLVTHFFVLFNFSTHLAKLSSDSTQYENELTFPFFLNFFYSPKISSSQKTVLGYFMYALFLFLPLVIFLLILIIISKFQSNVLFVFHFIFLILDFIIVLQYFKTLKTHFKLKPFLKVFHIFISILALSQFILYIFIVTESIATTYVQNRWYSIGLPILQIENEVITRQASDGSELYSSGFLNLKNRHFKYADFTNLSFYKTNFRNSDFSKSTLSMVKFDDCILQGSNYSNANLSMTKFNMSDLRYIDIQTSIFTPPMDFTGANIENCDFKEKDLSGSDFSETSAKGAVFTGSKLNRSIFNDTDLENATFIEAEAQWSDFNYANLKFTDFTGSKLNSSTFKNASLDSSVFIASEAQWTDFSCAKLKYADFTGASLNHSIFDGSNLYRTKFYAAEIYQGSLSYTDLRYTILQGANLDDAKLEGAIFHDMNFNRIGQTCQSYFNIYKNSGYSFFNLRGAFLLRSTGTMLCPENIDGNCIFYNEGLFYIDKNEYEIFTDSIYNDLSTPIFSNDSIQNQARKLIKETFRERMIQGRARYDSASAMKFWLPNSLNILNNKHLSQYLEVIEKKGMEDPEIIKSLIENYAEVKKDIIYDELNCTYLKLR